MSERIRPIATSSQTVGPFFHFGLTADARLGEVAPPEAPGERHAAAACASSTAPVSRCPTP